MAAEAAEAIGTALGIKNPHQCAVKAHAEAMKKWRETVKDLRQEDVEIWERMKSISAVAPLVQRQRQLAIPLASTTPKMMQAAKHPTAR